MNTCGRTNGSSLLVTIALGLLLFAAVEHRLCAQTQQGLVSCRPVSQKTGDTGCWIVATELLGALTAPTYWTLDVFPTTELAEQAKGLHGTVAESLGNAWLFTIGEKPVMTAAGQRVAQIGPLPIKTGQSYAAQYMEATLLPGMVSKTHSHSGVEVFYTENGETCLETPDGKQLGKKDTSIVVPEGVPMELSATGKETRRGMVLILHGASRPATMLVNDWKSKGLCALAN